MNVFIQSLKNHLNKIVPNPKLNESSSLKNQKERCVFERWIRGDDYLLDVMVGFLLAVRCVKRVALRVYGMVTLRL